MSTKAIQNAPAWPSMAVQYTRMRESAASKPAKILGPPLPAPQLLFVLHTKSDNCKHLPSRADSPFSVCNYTADYAGPRARLARSKDTGQGLLSHDK